MERLIFRDALWFGFGWGFLWFFFFFKHEEHNVS